MTQRGAECNSIDEPCDTQDQAFRYIEVLTGDINSAVTYQTFDDSGGGDLPPQVLHGTLTEVWNDLCAAQDNGHGVFVMVQQGDGKGRAGKNVTALRALFLDDDKGTVKLSMLKACRPNIIVHSGRGTHYYWLLVAGEKLTDFGPAQKALAARFGTDPAVHDLPRVMRMPGTTHYKNRSDPQDVTLLGANRRSLRTIADILELLGAKVAPVALGGAGGTPPSVAAPKGRVLHSVPDRPKKRARSYIKTVFAKEGEGGDATTYRVAAQLLHGFGLDYDDAWRMLCEWNLTNATPPWSSQDLGLKLERARKYGKGEAMPDPDPVAEVVAKDASLDPASYCYDTSRASAPWRPWRGTAWQEGIATVALDRLLENSGLDRHARDAWKRSVPVVIASQPVFSSRERLVATDLGLVANTYRAPLLKPESGDCSPALLVIQNLAGDDDASERHVVGWLAKMVQAVYSGRPARIGTALVLFGPRGSGKGVLESLIRSMLGEDNVASIGQAELNSQFNAWLEGKLCVFADEVFSSDNRASSLSAKVKNYITAHTLTYDQKGQPQRQGACAANWVFASNSNRPIEVESGDRRFSVIRTGPAIEVDLGSLVADDARDGGPITRAFLDYLLKRPAESLAQDYRPLETAAKAEVQRASGNSATRFALEVSERGFYSLTSSWVHQGGREVDLYLRSDSGLRRLEGVPGPLILRRMLMGVFRSYAQEVGAPATSEGTLMGALKEILPTVREATVDVGGKLERVIAGLPGAVAGEAVYAEAETTSVQSTLF